MQRNVADIQPPESNNNRATYANLFVGFAQEYFEARSVPPDDKTLVRATILYVELSRIAPQLQDFSNLNEMQSNIDIIIGKLQQVNTQTGKQTAAVFASERDQIGEKVKGSNMSRDALIKEYYGEQNQIFDMIRAVLARIAELEKAEQEKMGRDQVIDNQLTTGEKNTRAFKLKLEHFLKECGVIAGQLDKLHSSSFSSLPSTMQSNVPPPASSIRAGLV